VVNSAFQSAIALLLAEPFDDPLGEIAHPLDHLPNRVAELTPYAEILLVLHADLPPKVRPAADLLHWACAAEWNRKVA
jgi:hypothetical protein